MASAAVWNPVDSDDEVENSEEFRNSSRESLLVIIDASLDMFRPWEDTTAFRAAIKCCHSMWRSKIISNPKDLVGILLMATENKKNSSDFPNLYVLQEMSNVTVNMIVELEKMEASADCLAFCDNIGSSSDYIMRDLFWLSKILFEDAKTTVFSRKILFFTCEDNPHSVQADLRNDAIKKFKDLGNIEFSIITFNEGFDHSKFYSNILERVSISIPPDMDSLVKVVRMKQRLKRPLTRSTLELSPEIKIGVGVYSLIRRATPPKPVKINKRNNELVTKTVNKFRGDTGATILKSEEVSMVALKGEQIILKPDELKSAKTVYVPGLKLLGFFDQSDFNHIEWFHSDGYFLYPDEERWSGSQDLFGTLLRRCYELKKVALVRMIITRGRTPRLGCLIPTIDDALGQNQKLPDGFLLFKLPFSDEIRQLEYDWTTGDPTPNIVELMEKIVKKITYKNFDVLAVQNPALQNKWREIESAVLDDDGTNISSETFVDYTVPNTLLMRERIGELSRNFMETTALVSGGFRGNSSTVVKKPKPNMAMEARNKRVDRLTCDVLREFLDGIGVETKRKTKAKLVDEVYNHFT